MEENPYRSPPPVDEPAHRRPTTRSAAKRGFKIGVILAAILVTLAMLFVAVGSYAGVIPANDEVQLLPALLGGVLWTMVGGAFGASCGALFQAIANAIVGRGGQDLTENSAESQPRMPADTVMIRLQRLDTRPVETLP